MIVPNTNRVIIKPVPIDQLKSSGLVISGQLTAGEKLYYGKIVHAGDTKFEKGQGVFYSEYSSCLLLDVAPMLSGEKSFGEVQEDRMVVVSEDDILAYYDTGEVPETPKTDQPKAEAKN